MGKEVVFDYSKATGFIAFENSRRKSAQVMELTTQICYTKN